MLLDVITFLDNCFKKIYNVQHPSVYKCIQLMQTVNSKKPRVDLARFITIILNKLKNTGIHLFIVLLCISHDSIQYYTLLYIYDV